jgi:hypothetical protein
VNQSNSPQRTQRTQRKTKAIHRRERRERREKPKQFTAENAENAEKDNKEAITFLSFSAFSAFSAVKSFFLPMTIFRRFLVFAVLCFWQGGFVFYSSVAIPVGHRVLETHRKQALLTKDVAYFLNLAGMVSTLPLLWDLFAPDPSLLRRRVRAALWAMVLATLLVQVHLYRELNAMFPDVMEGNDPPSFTPLHRVYLWVSTAQFAAAVGYLLSSLLAWRAQDCASGNAGPREGT